jgi:glyceraldehyde 3-phosphate dehydrogenase
VEIDIVPRRGPGPRVLGFSNNAEPGETSWDDLGVEVVIESSGKFRTMASLAPYFERGVRKVVVAAPVKDERALNIVVGVNDDRYDPDASTS